MRGGGTERPIDVTYVLFTAWEVISTQRMEHTSWKNLITWKRNTCSCHVSQPLNQQSCELHVLQQKSVLSLNLEYGVVTSAWSVLVAKHRT